MAEYQVTCVTKPHRDSPHEAISRLGGPAWNLSRLEVVDRIERKLSSYFTQVSGRRAYLHVRVSVNGIKYVQTYADGLWTNNLLSLPECR